jgi:uncharacterized protein (DUF2147 family)
MLDKIKGKELMSLRDPQGDTTRAMNREGKRSMRSFTSALLASLVLLASSAFGGSPDAITGIWTTAENKAKIEIFKCGSNYCGKIIELKEATYSADDKKGMAGQPKVDRENPDQKLRTRPIVGMQMLDGFSYAGDNRWEGGTIYDPKNGKTYKCKITLAEPNQLKVRGFIGISLIGRTETWTR